MVCFTGYTGDGVFVLQVILGMVCLYRLYWGWYVLQVILGMVCFTGYTGDGVFCTGYTGMVFVESLLNVMNSWPIGIECRLLLFEVSLALAMIFCHKTSAYQLKKRKHNVMHLPFLENFKMSSHH